MMKIQLVVLLCGPVFEECCGGIRDALSLLGVQSSLQSAHSTVEFSDDIVYIIPGVQRINGPLPSRFIAVQTEQTSSKWLTEAYMAALRKAECVWDFSPLNVARFIGHGMKNVCFVPIRVPLDIFVESTDTFRYHFREPRVQDIDVLFYGSDSPRRRKMFKLISKIPNCATVFRYYTLFGKEREDLIRRSKIVLNLHYWPDSALEVHRIEYACARGKCIISEPSADRMLDLRYANCVEITPYGDIPKRVTQLLRDQQSRSRLEKQAQATSFKNQFDMSAIRACISSLK